MSGNTFGTLFKITTWGESHGEAIGVVIDGCPAGLEFSEEDVNSELALRKPGHTAFVSERKEDDSAQILSGVFEGKTTGAPISMVIQNKDSDPRHYHPIKEHLRPGHANFTYLEKYGIFDYRGGGRASARETASRVAAGALAKKLLKIWKIDLAGYLKQVGKITTTDFSHCCPEELRRKRSPIFCPDSEATKEIEKFLCKIKEEKDSIGGVVELVTSHLPIGLGEPVFDKLQAQLARAILSIPACKGIEIGSGFQSALMRGSEHNDLYTVDATKQVRTKTNHAGGILGGLSTGMPLIVRAVFKPTSSIAIEQETLTLAKEKTSLKYPQGSRHDPCVAIRAVPVVEAMCALVLVDALLVSRGGKIEL
jgi:chorismate synthase